MPGSRSPFVQGRVRRPGQHVEPELEDPMGALTAARIGGRLAGRRTRSHSPAAPADEPHAGGAEALPGRFRVRVELGEQGREGRSGRSLLCFRPGPGKCDQRENARGQQAPRQWRDHVGPVYSAGAEGYRHAAGVRRPRASDHAPGAGGDRGSPISISASSCASRASGAESVARAVPAHPRRRDVFETVTL
jgi:hypothetical protein